MGPNPEPPKVDSPGAGNWEGALQLIRGSVALTRLGDDRLGGFRIWAF